MQTLKLDSKFFKISNSKNKQSIFYHSYKGIENYVLFGIVCLVFFLLLLTPYIQQFLKHVHYFVLLIIFGFGAIISGILPFVNILLRDHSLTIDFQNKLIFSNKHKISFNDVEGLRMIRQEVEFFDESGIADTNNNNSETVDVVGIELSYNKKRIILFNLLTSDWNSWDQLCIYLDSVFKNESLPKYLGKKKREENSNYPNQKVEYIAYSNTFNQYQRGSIQLNSSKFIDPINEWRQWGRKENS